MSTLSYDQRDPKRIYDPDTFRVAWESVFAEPDPGVFSMNPIWKAAYVVFSWVRLWTYRILSIFSVVAACCWGCEYGCTACYTIWCVTPCLKLMAMQCIPLKTCLTICLDTCIRPWINVYSYFFYNIRVTTAKEHGGTQEV